MTRRKATNPCPRCGKTAHFLVPITHGPFKFACEDCSLEADGIFFANGPLKRTKQCPRGHPIPDDWQYNWWIHCPTCTEQAGLTMPAKHTPNQPLEE